VGVLLLLCYAVCGTGAGLGRAAALMLMRSEDATMLHLLLPMALQGALPFTGVGP
jgi:hypothetical protein